MFTCFYWKTRLMINNLQSTKEKMKRREEKRREEKRREEKRREEKRREEKRREEKRREEKRREEKRREEKRRESLVHGEGGVHRLHADKKTIQVFQRRLEQMADVLAYKHTGKCSHTCKNTSTIQKVGSKWHKIFPRIPREAVMLKYSSTETHPQKISWTCRPLLCSDAPARLLCLPVSVFHGPSL